MMMTIATKKSNESQKMYEEAQKSRYFLVNMLKMYFRESVDYHTVTKLKYSKDVYLISLLIFIILKMIEIF